VYVYVYVYVYVCVYVYVYVYTTCVCLFCSFASASTERERRASFKQGGGAGGGRSNKQDHKSEYFYPTIKNKKGKKDGRDSKDANQYSFAKSKNSKRNQHGVDLRNDDLSGGLKPSFLQQARDNHSSHSRDHHRGDFQMSGPFLPPAPPRFSGKGGHGEGEFGGEDLPLHSSHGHRDANKPNSPDAQAPIDSYQFVKPKKKKANYFSQYRHY